MTFVRVPTFIVLLATLCLSSCFTAPQQPASQAERRPPPSAGAAAVRQAAPAASSPIPQRRTLACLAEGESCSAPGAECCAGFICAGSRGPICVTRF